MQISQSKTVSTDISAGQESSVRNSAIPVAIAWSSLFFAVLQSICTFFAAVDGIRLTLGISSLLVSASVGNILDRFHADWIRVPMILFALLATSLNLLVLAQVRRLRRRPASQWRQTPPTKKKLRMERMQLLLSVATLFLIGLEEYLHFRWGHHL
ncbi:hypothetical protein FTO74_13695 [Granulicella sp. WH15]|uniref:hypothetical protein n=1 Tax=Granulicella sp. WH15 TaxID=2602070 RepID=UPI001366BACE|nr:hypothetical protein [Granulicella sp. WH15]QHN04297.1 hypothetical protein FTO74_13695 [Granulicella sp. WH15]